MLFPSLGANPNIPSILYYTNADSVGNPSDIVDYNENFAENTLYSSPRLETLRGWLILPDSWPKWS